MSEKQKHKFLFLLFYGFRSVEKIKKPLFIIINVYDFVEKNYKG